MIQLSTMLTQSSENRGRPSGPAERNGDFASKLDKQLGNDEQAHGKIRPQSGKELPETARAGRNRPETSGKKSEVAADTDADHDGASEADVLSDDPEATVPKALDRNEAAIAILPVTAKLLPEAAALPADAAPEEETAAEESGDVVLDRAAARNAAPAQGTQAKAETSARDQALLTQLTEASEQPETAGEKPAVQEAKQDAGLARPRVPHEFRLEIAKGPKEAGGAETGVSRGVQASSVVLPLTPAVTAQGADTPSLTPGTRQHFDAASIQQAVRPQDFSALVDRLVEARESARTGSVNLSVMHSDFGEVSLRFNHDNGNLSVAMASRDPDFARAVNAATPADGSQAGETPFQGGRREDGTGSSSSRADGSANPSSQGEHNGQGRFAGQAAGEQTDATTNPPGPAGRAARGGIYA